jgi:hypothetical protein
MADEIRTEGGVIVDERVEEQVEPGDHERFAHYVKKEKVWIPNRDPGKFPVCPQCKAIFEGLPIGGDNSDNSE